MRVFLPSTMRGLALLRTAGEVGPPPMAGFAVTPTLRESYASGDTEELEYVALTEAARSSLRLLAADPGQSCRRVVLAVDMPDTAVTWTAAEGRAAVRVDAVVPLGWVAAVHVDEEDAVPDVSAAVAALPAAQALDPDAQFTVDSAEAYELAWYATQELPALLIPPPPRDRE